MCPKTFGFSHTQSVAMANPGDNLRMADGKPRRLDVGG